MYPLSYKYLGMKSTQQQICFRQTLKSFYKTALYDTQEYEEFESSLRKICLDKNDPKAIKNLSKFILNFIIKKDPENKTINSLFIHKATNATSVLATLILRDKDFLRDLKQGGRHNFINYIELSMAEVLTTDNSLKLLFQFEKQETMKSVREMQYFRHNPPDQLLR